MFGAKRHIIGYLRQIGEYFEENSLDAIICNGVLGFGLNDPQEIENSFGKCLARASSQRVMFNKLTMFIGSTDF